MKPYYQDDAVTIWHGDCLEIVPTLGRFYLLLTDPPYGIVRDKGMGGGGYDSTGKYKRKPRKYAGGWDDVAPDHDTLMRLVSSANAAIIWGGNYFALPRGGRWLVWNKVQVMPSYSDAELAWSNIQGVSVKMFTMHCNAARVEQGYHPTQKPLALMSWCIGLAGDVQTILDPFAGSGTTGRAAKDLWRKAVLIEREERDCEIAARRMLQEVLAL